MIRNIFRIALLCIVLGGASIPFAFGITNNPYVVWLGNSLGSLVSAFVVIIIAERIRNETFKKRVQRFRIGSKVITIMDKGDDNTKIIKARSFINRHGLKFFALICPIFPGALLSTVTVYTLGLDKRTYKIWLVPGIFLVSGLYVFGYWYTIGDKLSY